MYSSFQSPFPIPHIPSPISHYTLPTDPSVNDIADSWLRIDKKCEVHSNLLSFSKPKYNGIYAAQNRSAFSQLPQQKKKHTKERKKKSTEEQKNKSVEEQKNTEREKEYMINWQGCGSLTLIAWKEKEVHITGDLSKEWCHLHYCNFKNCEILYHILRDVFLLTRCTLPSFKKTTKSWAIFQDFVKNNVLQ